MPARTESALQLVRAAARGAGLGERSDDELLAAFLAGDAAAFAALVRRHGPMVLRTCRAATRCEADADDAFQTTFVLLHRKAANVRDRRSLAGWLFRVARRSAGNARRAADRRAKRETRSERPLSTTPADLSWREACDVLHAEIDRLPETYRLPLVLCYLQGLTRDEAARRLGWTLNVLRGRLERGRSRLRGRLQKRGITLSAGLLAVVGTDLVPPKLIAGTVAAARSTSPVALPLAAGVWKVGLLAGLAATVVLGFALQKDGAHAQPAKELPKAVAESPKTAEPEPAKTITVSGFVEGSIQLGRPIPGATVTLRRTADPAGAITVRTGPDGKFQATIPAVLAHTPMVAVANHDDWGNGWAEWDGDPPREIRIRLNPYRGGTVRGRLLNTEGKPVAGVTARLTGLMEVEGGSYAYREWAEMKAGRPVCRTLPFAPPGATGEAVTDADGRFELHGLGGLRIVAVRVSGPSIAGETIEIDTAYVRRSKPIRPVKSDTDQPPPAKPTGNMLRSPRRVYPAEFDHVVSPGRIVRGTIRDVDTGKPVAGLTVNGVGGPTTTTDADGRYELAGIKKGPRYAVFARPADGSVYFPTVAEATDTAGLDPLVIDLTVKAGIPVRGRLKDAVSGKPVVGSVRYWPMAGNNAVGDVSLGRVPGQFFTVEVRTKPDGTFTVATLPDEGFLSVLGDGWYQSARIDPAGYAGRDGWVNNKDRLAIAAGGMATTALEQERYQAFHLLRIEPAKPPAEAVIELTPAEPVRGRFIDPDGKPLDGVRVRGLTMTAEPWSQPLAGAELTASPPHPDRPRWLTYRHDGRKLIGSALVKAGSAKPVEFKLEPWATLTGRLIDADGRPVARANVMLTADQAGRRVDAIGPVSTDATGRFTIDGIPPGVTYRLLPNRWTFAGQPPELTLKVGEEKDLGDIRVGEREP